jgi:hypothetical protein
MRSLAFQALLLYGGIDNSMRGISMEKSQILFPHQDGVVCGDRRSGPFSRIGALPPLLPVHHPVRRPPAFIIDTHGCHFFGFHLHVHHRVEHIHPDMHLSYRSGNGNISVFQVKYLAEITPAGKRIGGKPNTETPLFQQRVVFVE